MTQEQLTESSVVPAIPPLNANVGHKTSENFQIPKPVELSATVKAKTNIDINPNAEHEISYLGVTDADIVSETPIETEPPAVEPDPIATALAYWIITGNAIVEVTGTLENDQLIDTNGEVHSKFFKDPDSALLEFEKTLLNGEVDAVNANDPAIPETIPPLGLWFSSLDPYGKGIVKVRGTIIPSIPNGLLVKEQDNGWTMLFKPHWHRTEVEARQAADNTRLRLLRDIVEVSKGVVEAPLADLEDSGLDSLTARYNTVKKLVQSLHDLGQHQFELVDKTGDNHAVHGIATLDDATRQND